MEAVVSYLDEHDPAAAARARRRYECLQPFSGESTSYGEAVLLGVSESCRRQALGELVELRRRAADYLRRDGLVAEDEYFFAEQNAAVVANAEEYYRTMLGDRAASWNLRDRHMADTLDELMAHLDRHDSASRVVVWEHNSHIGDARATEMAGRGELNIGQLMRERHPARRRARRLHDLRRHRHRGLGSGARAVERKRVRPRHRGQLRGRAPRCRDPVLPAVPPRHGPPGRALREPRLERAIGVVYRPETERQSHWFAAALSRQFDALVHLDLTRAVEPLERAQTWDRGEPPETYPTAL